ncbi:MAG: O-antigen ligase family protein [Muribaculum sp.]|nr:O-antigen ligase family protein [Muribaculum sp.]
MGILNFVYFLIITFYGYKFLTSDGKIVKSALNRDVELHYSGPELFWCLTFSTGLLAFSANVGVDLMAIRLLVLEIFCLIGLSKVADKPIWSLPMKLYVVYLIWLLIGCFYGPSMMYGLRVILKYSYPLLLCLFASAVVRDADVFLKSSLFARTVGVISIIFSFVPLLPYLVPGVFWYGTARAINYISIMIFSLALFHFTSGKEKWKNLFYVALFILPCFIWVLRTSIMGSLVAIMAFYFIKYKLKSLPIIVGILILGVVAVFTIPSLKAKMFHDDNVTIEQFQNGDIQENNINTNARESMWKYLETKFYTPHQIIGSGTGSVQNFMYNNYVFGGLTVPHSDFVQMKCDNGLVALILYSSIAFLIFVHVFNTYWHAENADLKLCAIIAGASIAGVFVTLYSDNAVNYSMATLSMPFGFYGMMLGLKHRDR